MIVGAGIFAGAVAIALLVCLLGRYSSRQRLLRGRHPLAVAEIVNGLPDNLSRNEASEVLRVIGKSFGLQPEILRLEDPIAALTAIDSWVLGRGQEGVERWLRDKGVTSLGGKPNTIRDLIIAVLPFTGKDAVPVP